MNADWEDRVRARAHALWEREGCPEGGAERHWAQAEEELRAEAPIVEAAGTAGDATSTAGTETWSEAPAEAAAAAKRARSRGKAGKD
jgi:hypothetical protein